MSSRGTFANELASFRLWAADQRQDGEEWECDYPRLRRLMDSAAGFALSVPASDWTDTDVTDLLYAIARDNECWFVLSRLSAEGPGLIPVLARASLDRDADWNAKWQLASRLGNQRDCLAQIEELLLKYAEDPHECVRRYALMSLARLGSAHTERLALSMWDAPADGMEPWIRMAILKSLDEVGSAHFQRLLQAALVDASPQLSEFARNLAKTRSA